MTPFPRREWRFAPLCGAVATFSSYSKNPSRPPLGGDKKYGRLALVQACHFSCSGDAKALQASIMPTAI